MKIEKLFLLLLSDNENHSRKYSDNDNDFKRASSRGIIPKAKIKTVKMTFVIVFGTFCHSCIIFKHYLKHYFKHTFSTENKP
jgi:hypothetical protein